MSVIIEVDQKRTVEGEVIYKVETIVTYVQDIDSSIFVFETETLLYSHVAYPYDMNTYPKTKAEAEALGLGYYRQSSVIEDYDNVSLATEAAVYTLSRIDTLARTTEQVNEEFEGESSHRSTGE